MQIYDRFGQEFNFNNFETSLFLPILNTSQIRISVLSCKTEIPFIVSIENKEISIIELDGTLSNLKSYPIGISTILIYEKYSTENLQTSIIKFVSLIETLNINLITETVSKNIHLLNQVNSVSFLPYENSDYLLYNFSKSDFISEDSKLRELILEFPKINSEIGNANYVKSFFNLIELNDYSLIELRRTNFGLSGTDYREINSNSTFTTGDYILEIESESVFETDIEYENTFTNSNLPLQRIKKILSKIHEFILPVGTRIIEVSNSIHYNSPSYLLTGTTDSEIINCSFERNFQIISENFSIMRNFSSGFESESILNSHIFDLRHFVIDINVSIWKRELSLRIKINDIEQVIFLDDFVNLLSIEESLNLIKQIFYKTFKSSIEIVIEKISEFNFKIYLTGSDLQNIEFEIKERNINLNSITIIEKDLKNQNLEYVSKALNQKSFYGSLLKFQLNPIEEIFDFNESSETSNIESQFRLEKFINYDIQQPLETRLEDSAFELEILNSINLNRDEFVIPNILDLNFYNISGLCWKVFSKNVEIYSQYKKIENINELEYFFNKDGIYKIEILIYYFDGHIQNIIKEIEIKVPKISLSLITNHEDSIFRINSNGDFNYSYDTFEVLENINVSWNSFEQVKSFNEPTFGNIERSSIGNEMFLGSVFNNSWKIEPSNGNLLIYKNDIKTSVEFASHLNVINTNDGFCEIYDFNQYIGKGILIDCSMFELFIMSLELHKENFYFRPLNYPKNNKQIEGLLITQNYDYLNYSVLGLDGLQIQTQNYQRIDYINSFEQYSIYGFTENFQKIILNDIEYETQFSTLDNFVEWLTNYTICEFNPIYDSNNNLFCVNLINTSLLNLKLINFLTIWKKEEKNLMTSTFLNLKIHKNKIIHKGPLQIQLNHDSNNHIPENCSYNWTFNNIDLNIQLEYKEKYPIVYLTEIGNYDIQLLIKTDNNVEIKSEWKSWLKIK